MAFHAPAGHFSRKFHAFILSTQLIHWTAVFTMRCPACAYENKAASRFCVACGVSLAPVCVHCGRDFPETARFCAWCGEPRTPGARVMDVPGERKQATVLFADVAGSTARIASLDAEGAMNFLHPIVMVMARAVNRYDGTVLRTLGDG